MSENNDYIQLPPLKKDTSSDVVAFMWEYMKVPEDSRGVHESTGEFKRKS